MSSLNSYTVVASQKGIVLFADVEETFNVVSGDVDQTIKCNFYNEKTAEDIGYAKIKIRGQYKYVSGDPNGRSLLDRFQLLTA